MDKPARRRWAIMLSVLTLTIAAIFYPLDQDAAGRLATPIDRTVGAQSSTDRAYVAGDGGQDDNSGLGADPFAPRGWKAPPPPVQAPPKVAAAPVMAGPVVPPAPVGPPPLPFRFTGRLNDGGEQVIYLSRGDQILVVRNGETLEGTYKVLAVEALRMEFEHLPTGVKQTLTLAAPGS